MKNFIFSLILISSTSAFAVDMAEEGMVLNQELQFLQESAKAPAVVAQAETTTARARNPKAKVDSLERMYFEEDSDEDTITTKAAGRKRRKTD
ncbi:MAG TPA: hypothetical protein VNJ08_06070 [Bacteriovoracaceae bacterium]|nr:hypothetical protein [Bacteriovoracaceae bacterium]